MKSLVLMFQEQFAVKVKAGTKRHTIRPIRKDGRRPITGTVLSLRKWEGSPYRSKQIKLRKDTTCVSVKEVVVCDAGILVEGGADFEPDEMAKWDGFESFAQMKEWFENAYGLPFTGILIRW